MTAPSERAPARRWVCLDVGETLIDEHRIWETWADELGVRRHTFAAALGGAIVRGRHHPGAFEVLGIPDWSHHAERVQRRYGGFCAGDLYPDALPCLRALSAAGYGVAVVANQPARRHGELEALGVRPDVMAMSEAIGVEKPDPAFFERALHLLGDPDPGDVAYVGDRVDNDVEPAAAAGMRAVWIRRGPWGLLQEDRTGAAALVVRSLFALPARLASVW